jgi:hypothetical protein
MQMVCIFIRKTWRDKSIWGQRCRWEDDIKMDVKETGANMWTGRETEHNRDSL